MKPFLLLFMLALAGCVAAPPAAGEVRPLSPQEAGAIVIDATNTAAAMATENAVATQRRLAAEQEAGAAGTATMQSIVVIQTRRADDFTSTALVMGIDATQAAATRDAIAEMRAASATQAAVAIQATDQAAIRARDRFLYEGMVNLALAAFGATLMIVVWYLRSIARAVATRYQPDQDPKAIRVVRTSTGDLLLIPTRTGVARELLPRSGTDPSEDDFEDDTEAAEQPEDSPLDDEPTTASQADEANRRFILRFLRDAMAAGDRSGKKLPTWRDMHYASNTWQAAVALIGEHVAKSKRGAGGGTWLDCSLLELYEAVGERRFMPRVIVESPSPAPQPSMAES